MPAMRTTYHDICKHYTQYRQLSVINSGIKATQNPAAIYHMLRCPTMHFHKITWLIWHWKFSRAHFWSWIFVHIIRRQSMSYFHIIAFPKVFNICSFPRSFYAFEGTFDLYLKGMFIRLKFYIALEFRCRFVHNVEISFGSS
jgi:hypothetical protein